MKAPRLTTKIVKVSPTEDIYSYNLGYTKKHRKTVQSRAQIAGVGPRLGSTGWGPQAGGFTSLCLRYLLRAWWGAGEDCTQSRRASAWHNTKALQMLALIKDMSQGAWVAQSVERPTSARVTISRFVSSSPASGSVLTARSPEPASDALSPSLCPSPARALSVSLKNK